MLTVRSTINFASQTVPPIIPVVQGDPGRAILFTLADFTIPAGATATYYVQKPSGEAVYNNATIDGNNVLVNLTAQSIIEKGDNYGQVRIAVGEDVVTSFDFILLVKEFRGIDAVQSLTEMNIFDKAVEQASEAIDEVKTDALEAIDDAKDEAIEEVTSNFDLKLDASSTKGVQNQVITQAINTVNNAIGDLSGETVTPTATNNYGVGGNVGQVIETWATTEYWHGIYTVSAGNTYGITTVSDFPQQLVVWFTNASNTIIENHKAFATDHVEMVCTAPTGATKLYVMSYGYDAYHGTVQKVEPLSETVSNLKEDLSESVSDLKSAITKNTKLLQIYPVRDAVMYKNLMYTPAENIGKGLDLANGELYTHATTNVSDFFPAVQGKTLYFSQNGVQLIRNQYKFNHLTRYDANFNYLGSFALGAETSEDMTYTVQAGDVWLRCVYGSKHTNLQIEYDEVTAYHAYGNMVTSAELSAVSKLPDYLQLAIRGDLVGANKTILLSNGTANYNAGYSDNYCVSDFIDISLIKGYTIKNAMSWTLAGAFPIAFYNSNKNIIGTAYTPTSNTALTPVDIPLTDELLANYSGVAYARIGINLNYVTSVWTKENELISNTLTNDYPSYKVNGYPSIFFGGDSVTQGFVVEGTQDNPSTIYQEMPNYSYPASFGRIYAGAEITKVAQSGIDPYGYYTNKYPNIDFSLYNLIIIELGLNAGTHGYLNIDDIDDNTTNSWYYNKLIEGIRGQNSDAQIVLVRSQYWMPTALPLLEQVAENWNCLVIDLHDTTYLDLANPKYHGYFDNAGTPAIDYAHFTRQGYAAKAYVVARLLGDLLP